MKKKTIKAVLLITGLLIFILIIYILYDKVYLEYKSVPSISIIGDNKITLECNSEYVEQGAKAVFRNKNISNMIVTKGTVDVKKVGSYRIVYEINIHKKNKQVIRNIEIVDTTAPSLTLEGDEKITLTTGMDYVEPGYKAIDNYDGDITSSVETTNNIDNKNSGIYEVTYNIKDSSGNISTIKRIVEYIKPKVTIKELPSVNANATKIAVLNYHFFYDPSLSEDGGNGNFISVQDFEEQLKYLQNNGYKTLSMEEFRSWMYGEIELPARSVLLTIDDGAAGTGFENGNKLIPILEKYNAHATLFLISGWWPKANYISPNLDIESHSHDLHTSDYCSGVSRGAKMLCLNNEQVLADLKQSIDTLGSSTAFCFPFYAYNNNAISLVEQAGFKLAFIGGDYKATRDINKYKIPRYHVYKSTTLSQFINMIS